MEPTLLSDVGWCRAMRDVFAQHGLDVDALLAEAGLGDDHRTVDPIDITDAFSRAWALAAERTGDPAIGLTRPTHPLEALGMLSHVVLAASDVRSAFQSISRFTHLASPTASVELNTADNRFLLRLHILPGRLPVAPQRYDYLAMTCVHGLHWVTGCGIRPVAFHRPGPEPAQPQRWPEAFGCPVTFGAPTCLLELPGQASTQRIPTAHATVSGLCERMAAQMVEHLGSRVSVRVRRELTQQLSKGEPRREAVAAALRLSERTLQRRLTEEGTSFAELLDDVRREAAERYLRQGDFTPTEMTFALGFSDPSNFYRACKRWFGCPPGMVRLPG